MAGEALVDLAATGPGTLRVTPGGSPYNVAIGLGRLGVPTAYLGPRSTDGFGATLTDGLRDAAVDLSASAEVDAPTTLAVVHLDAVGGASYSFYLEGTSAASMRADDVPALPDGAGLHVSFGAIGATTGATGAALSSLLRAQRGRRLVSLDPNLRPSAVGDVTRYCAHLDDLVAACDLVKASDEDLAVLGDVDEVASRWSRSGPAVVVVTRGPDGASAFVDGDRLDVPGRTVEVVDTVGAGDACTAGLLWALTERGVDTRATLDVLAADRSALREVVAAGILVAALTCTRPGADPPRREELPPDP